jgi:tripartite-type tricarboxylate transporter receptor subunit TctC
VDRISALFGEAVRAPQVENRLKELGGTSASDTPAEFRKFLTDDRAKWEKLADAANLHEKE